MHLSVIIVNFNVKYFLEQCLYSVIKACRNIEAEIIVVDNNSVDGSRDYLAPKFPAVKFFWQLENVGFGKANNVALEHATGDHILFLNPDTIVPEDCFTSCIKFFNTAPDCGALGVRMIDGSGRFLKESKRGLPSATASFFKMTGLAGIFPSSKIFAAYYNGHLSQGQVNEVDVLAGAFMMVTREMVRVTKGFDEDFFMYAEDVDLSYRIQKSGKKNYYFPGTTIIHFKGESTQRISPAYIKHFYGAMLLFVKKHYHDKKMVAPLTKFAIHASRYVARIKMYFLKNRPVKPVIFSRLIAVLVCNQSSFNDKINLLKYSTIPFILIGRVSLTKEDAENNIGYIANLRGLVNSRSVNTVIFCEGELTFKKIIETFEVMPRKILPMLNASGSQSLVGSSSKTGNGFVINWKPEAVQ